MGGYTVSMSVIELRQYTLRPGSRDRFIDRFERHFTESQDAVGIDLIGTFRDLADPDRYVWLRSFPNHAARAASLDAFYTGPVWKEHRNAANADIVDSDDVLQLRPLVPFPRTGPHPPLGAAPPESRIMALILYTADEAIAGPLRELLKQAGGEPLATLVTDPAPNAYSRLPIRQDGPVLVQVVRFPGKADQVALHPLGRKAAGQGGRLDLLMLAPTARSSLA